MLDSLFVTFPSLLLNDERHRTFGMFDNRGLDVHSPRFYEGFPANGVFPGPELMYVCKSDSIANFEVIETGYGEEVPWG